MQETISGIYRIPPTYPVKPVQPANKDRETDQRKKPRYDVPEQKEDRDKPSDEDKPTIDEHV